MYVDIGGTGDGDEKSQTFLENAEGVEAITAAANIYFISISE